MARLVPMSLTFTEKRWFTALIKRHQMRPMFLKQKLPTTTAQGYRNLYLDKVDPAYTAKLARPLKMNAIGWFEGKPVFILLRGQIGPVIQKRAFDELEGIAAKFTSCNQSARPELKKAVGYNQHKNPEAKEWNPGHNATRHGTIDPSKHGATVGPHVGKLLQTMWSIYQRTLPMHWLLPSMLCPDPLRLAGTGFGRLAVLKSAASAIHTDGANGTGFACMTTLGSFPRYTGGTFCFVAFGVTIAVQPGDILIAATPQHLHCNVGPIKGLKYSIVAYFRKVLGTSQKMNAKYRKKTGAKFDTWDEREQRKWDRLGMPRPKHWRF
jgi:hypothetical protein